MAGCDVVVSALSALSEAESFSLKKLTPPHTLATTMGHIITVMKELGLKRIVTFSSIGAGDSRSYAPWYMRLIIKLTNFRLVFADHDAQETLMRQSGLDWIIARPVALDDKGAPAKLLVEYQRTQSPFAISRCHLAHFMVDSLQGDTYVHKAPLLAEKPL